MKPEIRNVSLRRRRRTEPARPWVTCTKSGEVWTYSKEDTIADRQTHRHIQLDTLSTILHSPVGEGHNYTLFSHNQHFSSEPNESSKTLLFVYMNNPTLTRQKFGVKLVKLPCSAARSKSRRTCVYQSRCDRCGMHHPAAAAAAAIRNSRNINHSQRDENSSLPHTAVSTD